MPKTKKIGPYVVSHLLGEGKFGKVKLGIHVITNEKVALKIIDTVHTKNLDREISSMQLLEHPNVVKLIEVVDVPNKPNQICLVMEYLDGGDLYDCIENKPLDERQAADYFYQLLRAVDHCHQRQVVHRDLKPENILLDKAKKTVKITDFGLCNLIESGAYLISNCGSPLYASPEILTGKKYGPQVDAWSLGVILYAMVTGCLPWPGDTIQEQVVHATYGHYAPPPDVSEACEDVISRLLVTDPDLRATIKEMLEHPWVTQGKLYPDVEDDCVTDKLHTLHLQSAQDATPSTLDP